MVESMLTFMLGPLRQITDFYMEHLLVVIPLSLQVILRQVFLKRKKL